MSPAAVRRQGRSRPDACSVVWDGAHASALGTAPAATFWVALEQNGPWGAQAATQSHLDVELGRTLTGRCKEAAGRFILIRAPGSHADPHDGAPSDGQTHTGSPKEACPRRAYLAGGLAGRPWLLEADLGDPARLARLPWSDLSTGDIDVVQDALPEFRRSPGPVLMICTNSRRDVCCSVRGRPVAIESASARPGQVWECSHTGGHRFAPTGVLLPHGQTFGRLGVTSAVAAVDAAVRDQVPTELLGERYDRGRSHLTAAGQVAESLIRERIREPSLLALSTTVTPQRGDADPDNAENADKTWQCRISHVDGRNWDVVAARHLSPDVLPESCGKEPVPRWQWSGVIGSGR